MAMVPHRYYKTFRYFGQLCEVPKGVLDNLNEYYEKLKFIDPILDDTNYKQWQVQTCNTNAYTKSYRESSYSHWTDDSFLNPTKLFFRQFVTNMYKFRFSYLKKSAVVEYHTSHVLPRIHIPLNNAESIFCIKDDNGAEHKYNLEYGYAHLVNVVFHHKVLSEQDNRINSFFSFPDFVNEKLKKQFLR